MEPKEIKKRIEQGIPESRAEVEGADEHYSAVVVSPAFAGRSRIDQHRMIYALFRDEMASQKIHALALRTCTPEEWESERRDQTR